MWRVCSTNGFDRQAAVSATIIVPVYNAYGMLDGLFDSLARTVPHAPIIVINDASPDGRVDEYLRRLSSKPFTNLNVLHNDKNLGFVATVNHGIRMCDNDVIVLNQDTIVTAGWYEKLEQAGSLDRIATVTPLTNNGEIASVPVLCENNPVPSDVEKMAQACARDGDPDYPEVPTAVGFCMLIKRTCIDAIGLLDAQQFGHGYGEENDYSCRAKAAGLRNILCDNAYVAHIGNQSFQDLDLQPNQTALDKVLARYPDYMDNVRAFIANDPLREKRRRIGEIYRQLQQATE